jgi:hypothetical protein
MVGPIGNAFPSALRKKGENVALAPSIQAGLALIRGFTPSVSAAICKRSRIVRVGAHGMCHGDAVGG